MLLLTGKSFFERVISNRRLPFPLRVFKIKDSINFTSTKSLTYEIKKSKNEKTKSLIHGQLFTVMHKLDLYKNLILDIEQIRKTKVTSTDVEHVELFEKVWSRLVTQADDDNEPLNMVSKRWTKIGFQVRIILHLSSEFNHYVFF